MSCSSPRAERAANFRNPLQQLQAVMSRSAGEGRTSVPVCCSQLPSTPASHRAEKGSGDGETMGIEPRQLQILRYSGYPHVSVGKGTLAGRCKFAWMILASCSRSSSSSASFFLAFPALGEPSSPSLAELGCFGF